MDAHLRGVNPLSALKIETAASGDLSSCSLSQQQTSLVAQKHFSKSDWQSESSGNSAASLKPAASFAKAPSSLTTATVRRDSIPSVPLEAQEKQKGMQATFSRLSSLTSLFTKTHQEEVALKAKEEATLEDRTRQGFVTYSHQYTKATFSTLEAVYKALDKKLPASAKATLDQSFANVQLNLGRVERTLSHRQAFNLLPDAVAQHLTQNTPRGEAARAELEMAMKQPVLGGKENAEMLENAAAEVGALESECQSLIFAFLEKAISDLSPAEQAHLRPFIDGIKKEVPLYMGNERANQLHAQEEWHEKAAFTMSIQGSDQSNISFLSTYQANGMPYSSALPRNRSKEETCPANFFATALENSAHEVLFSSSRSATPTEFGIDDSNQRAESTRQNVKMILDRQVQKAVQEASDRGEPIGDTFTHNTQMLLLMTPDLARDLGSKLRPEKINRADNERLLSEETIAANKHWNGRQDKIKVTLMVEGQAVEKEILVTYRTSTFNIPCNTMHEKLSGSFLKPAIAHAVTDRANQEALKSMGEQKAKRMQALNKEISRYASDPKSAMLIQDFKNLMKQKEGARLLLSQAGSEAQEKKALAEWQALSLSVKTLLESNRDQPQKLIGALKQQHLIEDAFADVKEMIDKKVYNNLKIIDKSRYALGARILFLGHLLGTSQHFTCRSGKDRTGLQDSEAKLVAAEVAAEGRFLSFHETKYRASHDLNRIFVTTQSGNDVHNTKANVGMRWYNIKGARLSNDRFGLQEVYSRLLSSSKVFKRPKTGKTTLLDDNSPMAVNQLRAEKAAEGDIESQPSRMKRTNSL